MTACSLRACDAQLSAIVDPCFVKASHKEQISLLDSSKLVIMHYSVKNLNVLLHRTILRRIHISFLTSKCLCTIETLTTLVELGGQR